MQSPLLGGKPALVFVGSEFEHNPVYARLQNFFAGHTVRLKATQLRRTSPRHTAHQIFFAVTWPRALTSRALIMQSFSQRIRCVHASWWAFDHLASAHSGWLRREPVMHAVSLLQNKIFFRHYLVSIGSKEEVQPHLSCHLLACHQSPALRHSSLI